MRGIGSIMVVGLTVSGAGSASAQAVIDSLVAANRYTVELEGGRLSGPGVGWLLDALDGVQFVVLGESHNEAEIPQFTAALYEMLRERSGYRYVAFENGPTAMEGIAGAAALGGRDSADAWAARYPNALQFWTDEEVDAIARVVAAEGRNGVWGLDQEWGAVHVLDRLAELAATDRARAAVMRVRSRVAPIESERTENGRARYITSADAVTDSDLLRSAFDAEPGSVAAALIDRLALSARIYGLRRGRVGYYESNELRERSMKTAFMHRYREAQAAGDTLPRLVVKFGHVHSVDGRNPSDVLALGSFLSQLAISNGQRSFHMAIYGVNEAGRNWTLSDYADYAPLSKASRVDEWTLLDLRPIRPWVSGGRIEDLNETLRDVILGFDAVLVIGGLSDASRERITGAR